MTLEDDLQDIDGIGPATAEKIVRIVDEHDSIVPSEKVEWAVEQAQRGNEREVIEFLGTLR